VPTGSMSPICTAETSHAAQQDAGRYPERCSSEEPAAELAPGVEASQTRRYRAPRRRPWASNHTTPRYCRICSNSNAVASQVTSWHADTRQIPEPLSRASATTFKGNLVSRSFPHFGHVTGNLILSSFIANRG
jgi:hypothetical protein